MSNLKIKKTLALANSVKLEEIFSLNLKNYLENEWYVRNTLYFTIKCPNY
jgi:hypothetical protein